jgi:hypothetical protein
MHRNILYDIGVSLIANLCAMLIVALVPFVAVVIVALASGASPLCVIVAAGWSMTGIVATLWYRNHRRLRTDRLMYLADLMSNPDLSTGALIARNHGTSSLIAPDEDLLRLQITQILIQMCRILLYRVRESEKGAAFFLVQGEGFRLFASHQHRGNLAIDVNTRFTRKDSLAGQALDESSLRVLRDCRRPPANIRWQDLGIQGRDRSRYIGRAIAPVQALSEKNPGEAKDIGVLCFDVARPLVFTGEEELLMMRVADKITDSLSTFRLDTAADTGSDRE